MIDKPEYKVKEAPNFRAQAESAERMGLSDSGRLPEIIEMDLEPVERKVLDTIKILPRVQIFSREAVRAKDDRIVLIMKADLRVVNRITDWLHWPGYEDISRKLFARFWEEHPRPFIESFIEKIVRTPLGDHYADGSTSQYTVIATTLLSSVEDYLEHQRARTRGGEATSFPEFTRVGC